MAEGYGTTEDEMVGWYHCLMHMSLSKPWELVIDREAWQSMEPRESHGQMSLVGYSPWGHTELDMIEQVTLSTQV